MRKYLVLIFIFLLIVIFSAQVLAVVESGGEFEVLVTGIWNSDGSFDSDIVESLDLELFLPSFADNEVHYAFRITKPLQDLLVDEKISYFTKKLYLRHRFEKFNLTVGRQPVSWSFGSLLNPVDYTLRAVAMDVEYNKKYTDAVEVYIPINWNSGLVIVSSFPGGFTDDLDKMKWGIRGRMGVRGYDLAMNYVQEPGGLEIPEKRIGLTMKGDLGDIGVYAGFGHYFTEVIDSSNSYLLGMDYSYNINYFNKMNIQLEYLNLDDNNLSPLPEQFMMMYNGNKMLEILSGSLNYDLDDFSSISLMTMVNLEDSSTCFIPSYRNTLAGNLDLEISSQVFLEGDSVLTAISMTYPF